MKLRARLVAVTIAVSVPMVAALVWLDGRSRRDAAAYVLSELTKHRLDLPGEQARCEADPAGWAMLPALGRAVGVPPLPFGGLRPPRFPDLPATPLGAPPVAYVYAADLTAAQHRAPRLTATEVRGLAEATTRVLHRPWYDDEIQVVARTPWGAGPCAYVVAHATTVPGFLGALLPASPIWLLPLAAVLIAILIAVGPMISRLRRLTAAVTRSAERGFVDEVQAEGRDEVKDLSLAFAAASREVRAQLAAKDQRERTLRDFLANTTHDVMIPLTVLQAHLTTLHQAQQRDGTADPAVLTAAMDEAHYIGALLHNLAVAAKLDAGEPALLSSRVDLNALVLRVVGRHATIARSRRIELEHALPEVPLVTDGDVTMLEQAVSNLVFNAIRHNRAGGHVAVTLERVAGERFRIRVLDDGPGIAAGELAHLLERGRRGDDARTRDPEGRGLGLDIVQRVVALHGHALRLAASEPGGVEADLEGPLSSPVA